MFMELVLRNSVLYHLGLLYRNLLVFIDVDFHLWKIVGLYMIYVLYHMCCSTSLFGDLRVHDGLLASLFALP